MRVVRNRGTAEYGSSLRLCLPIPIATVLSLVVLVGAAVPVLYAVHLGLQAEGRAGTATAYGLGALWHGLEDRNVVMSIVNSLYVATGAALISTVLGGMIAIAGRLAGGGVFSVLTFLYLFPLVTPDIMIGLVLNHALYYHWQLNPALWEVAFAHAVFGTALCFFVTAAAFSTETISSFESALACGVRGLGGLWRAIGRRLVGPLAAGAMVVFVVSLDDFAVTFFLAGAGEKTFPVLLHGVLQKGLRSSHFAVASLVAILNGLVVIAVLKIFGLGSFGLDD